MNIEENISLAPMTTFGIGGPARFLVHIKTTEDLAEARDFARKKGLALFILGGGSNVLVPNAGFDGLACKIELQGISIEKKSGAEYVLAASAGENWDDIVERAVQEGLWGIENLSGIPGTLGGAVVQNIGAYGAAISESIDWIEVWNISTGTTEKRSPQSCAFDYRDSVFKREPGTYVVLRAALRVSASPLPKLSYRDLKTRFEGKNPSLFEIREAVIAIRKEKFPDLTREGSAGSFFKNPIMSRDEAEKLRSAYPDMPLYDMPETTGMKVPLAWFLDRILHQNGRRLGSARQFERQPIVLVADRGGVSSDVTMLAEQVRADVRTHFGIEIENEAIVVD